MKKILVDLKHAILGYSGIPQDNRLTMKTLATLPGYTAGGLVWPISSREGLKNNRGSELRYRRFLREANQILTVMAEPLPPARFRLLRGLERLQNIHKRFTTSHFPLSELDREYWWDFVWRELLSKSLEPTDQEALRQVPYYYTPLDWNTTIWRTNHKVSPPRLATNGFDFIVFQDSSPVSVSRGTQKIIRYHDAVPLIRPELIGNAREYSRFHAYGTAACSRDSFYVCNSEPTRQDLVSLFPELEQRSTTIPYALAENKRTLAPNALPAIVRARLSLSALPERRRGGRKAIQAAAAARIAQPFLMAVSTIEPRKNYIGMIRAWERMRYRSQRDMPLVVVGNPGWKFNSSLAAMEPHVDEGSIIHLESVSLDELRILYSHATALISASFYEGFGFPPMEAMQCGCPTLVSDIAAHRWVMGDAPLYFDPYDIDAMAAAIDRVTDPEADGLRQDMAAKGLECARRYTVSAVAPQWSDLFERLQATPL